jgi:hypothetical protein
MRTTLTSLLVCAAVAVIAAAPQDVASRARGSAAVVVAKVVDVQSRFDVNKWGDRLIVSDAFVDVEETLKGKHVGGLTVTVEGGTVGDLTMNVSDMQGLRAGERAVLFLDLDKSGRHVPHDRGNGIVKLDADNRVSKSTLTLADIRAQLRGVK